MPEKRDLGSALLPAPRTTKMSMHTYYELEGRMNECECHECDKEEWMKEIEQYIEREYSRWISDMDPLAPEWTPYS